MTVWEMIATERRRLADDLEQLTDEQWRAQSQCDKWKVEEAAAHVIMPLVLTTPRFVLSLLKNRGNQQKTIDELTARVHAAHSRDEVIAALRAEAENQWTPPRYGPEIPLSEVVVHGQDIRRVLGIESEIPAATIEAAVSWIDDPDIKADYERRIGV